MKTILSIIMAFILLSASVMSASLTAFPIDLKLNPSAMYFVKITDINTGVVFEQYTDINGFFHLEWANIDDGVRYTDSFKATIAGKDYPLTGVMDGIDETISVTGVDCIPQVKEVPVEVIKEVIVYQDKNVYVCSDGTTRDTNDCPTIPTNDINILVYGILGLIFGALLVKYTPYGGKVRITRYQDRYGKQKMKIEKYEKYLKTTGIYGYRWKVVSDVFA